MNIEIPEDIRAAEPFLMEVRAIGVQIYTCQPKAADPTAFEWVLVEPDADLFDTAGVRVGRHFRDQTAGGPAWELADGSKVVVNANAAKPHAVPHSIPWLLVPAKVATGLLAGVASVQRLETLGGTAPVDTPGPEDAGRKVSVRYTATYYLNGCPA